MFFVLVMAAKMQRWRRTCRSVRQELSKPKVLGDRVERRSLPGGPSPQSRAELLRWRVFFVRSDGGGAEGNPKAVLEYMTAKGPFYGPFQYSRHV